MADVSGFQGAVAIITGAGSGIGKALALALAGRGAFVYASDVDELAARAVADEIGAAASAAQLDVRDPKAVQAYVRDVEARAGRVDFLFNNAGIGMIGEVQDLTLAHWERAIDVNLRGVVHGIHAVYPGMIARGRGHVVNVASMAGLVPGPVITAYATTKHAVVGLSISLRLEAEVYGVRVSALCPGVIETPILDRGNASDLPAPKWTPSARQFLTRAAGKPFPAAKLAEQALDAVLRNEGVIVLPASARMAARIGRLAPSLFAARLRQVLAQQRADKRS